MQGGEDIRQRPQLQVPVSGVCRTSAVADATATTFLALFGLITEARPAVVRTAWNPST